MINFINNNMAFGSNDTFNYNQVSNMLKLFLDFIIDNQNEIFDKK